MEEMEAGEVQVHNSREWHNQNTQEDFFESKAQLPMRNFSWAFVQSLSQHVCV